MNRKILLTLAVFAVVIATIQAAKLQKRAAAKERPEAPLLLECEEPGENREGCFYTDPSNYDNWVDYLKDVESWEKANPDAAKAFNEKNPNKKKEEKAKLDELAKFNAIHQ